MIGLRGPSRLESCHGLLARGAVAALVDRRGNVGGRNRPEPRRSRGTLRVQKYASDHATAVEDDVIVSVAEPEVSRRLRQTKLAHSLATVSPSVGQGRPLVGAVIPDAEPLAVATCARDGTF